MRIEHEDASGAILFKEDPDQKSLRIRLEKAENTIEILEKRVEALENKLKS